eukprot:34444_5
MGLFLFWVVRPAALQQRLRACNKAHTKCLFLSTVKKANFSRLATSQFCKKKLQHTPEHTSTR